eukprot:CCRYP_003459-RA/>CCRYP_003459-RA protein AED:0.01 eAED:0.01 QI:558/1/1/1/1/1/2/463/796
MKQTSRRPALRTSSVWIMILTSSRVHVGAYTFSPVRSLSRKRSLANIGFSREECHTCVPANIPRAAVVPSVALSSSPPPRWCKDSSLAMSLDSRELRFYASSVSSSHIARAMSSSGSNGGSVTKTVSTTRTVTKSADGSMRVATYESRSKAVTSRDALDALAPPPISIYSHGLAGLMSTFDHEFKRAFSYPTRASNAMVSAHYSTSSALFTSIEDFDVKSSGGTSEHQRKNEIIRIDLTEEEQELFDLLRTVTAECGMKSTLRVAGGWVRDKILASKDFLQNRRTRDFTDDGSSASVASGVRESRAGGSNGNEGAEMNRITSKFKGDPKAPKAPCSIDGLSATAPVDIDIALDDKLGREFADELNQWLSDHGRETHSVGVVLKNPEKSKHLETATMRINNYWIDFVNLRAEEYTSDSRIPDLMRIGTAEEDAFRRDLTINSLFYNINDGVVEDMTGRGLEDLKKGIVATPLPPLTTLLDDPLRVLRSVRFAARLRFGMDESLKEAAADSRVKLALEQKVSRERVGSEVDLMLKSRDPVGAMRLLINLGLIETAFPLPTVDGRSSPVNGESVFEGVFDQGLSLLTTTHDHLCDCKANPPLWCEAKRALEAGAVNGVGQEETRVLMEDEDARRLLWYAAFLKPLRDRTIQNDEDKELEDRKKPRKGKRSAIINLLVDDLKRPSRDADAVEKIMRAADGFTKLVQMGSDFSALSVLLSEIHVVHRGSKIVCSMNNRAVDPNSESDPIWNHCMEFRKDCAAVLKRIGPLWRAALILSLCEQLLDARDNEIEYPIEGDMVS